MTGRGLQHWKVESKSSFTPTKREGGGAEKTEPMLNGCGGWGGMHKQFFW